MDDSINPIPTICRLRENQYYTMEELSGLLDSHQDANAFVDYMRKQEVCKTKTDVSNKTYSFSFVGLIEFEKEGKTSDDNKKRRVVFIEPKFFPTDREGKREGGMDECQKIVLKAILKYHKSQQISSFSSGRLTSYEGCSTPLSTKLALIRDVMEKGIYQVPKIEMVVNGQGDVDWNETFATLDPVFLQDGPCYANTVNGEMGYDDDTYISRLQMCLASRCISYFEEIGLAEPLGLFLDTPYDGDLSDFGSKEYCASRIENELRTQFIDDKKNTLRLMKAVLENESRGHDALESQSFGTSGFHSLWEQAIKDVFCDELPRRPKDLFNGQELERIEKQIEKKEKLDKQLKEFIDPPLWKQGGTENVQGETDRLRPDFVAIARDKNKELFSFIILDAKYYVPEFKGETIDDAPGVSDINKQVLYQLAYSELISSCGANGKVHNAFMFPWWNPNWSEGNDLKAELFATIIVPSFGPCIDEPLKAYRLDGIELLQRYVYNECDDERHSALMKICECERTDTV